MVTVKPELKDIAARRFDRPVFVDCADERALGLEKNAVIGRVRDGASRKQRGEHKSD